MRLHFIPQPGWPPLAWLARCEKHNPTVSVFHGARVERADDWFCEAVWDADYACGDFDQTDIVAGSGARVRGGSVRFVSAGNTVDRLQSIVTEEATWVSNSLACLSSASEAVLDPTYGGYYEDSFTVTEGLDKYKRTIATSLGEILLTYFDNLVWDGTQLAAEAKPNPQRDFSSFEAYAGFLRECMARVAQNMRAREREFDLTLLGSLSSGYDSTAVSTLGKEVGLTDVVTFEEARGGGSDSGEATAKLLGLKAHKVEREAWRESPYAEVPFIASYSTAEDVIFKGIEDMLHGRVLMTGYHGDWVWDKRTPDLGDQIMRKDASGLALTEYRLWAGAIHCAVPFWGVRQMRDINALSNAAHMQAWDVGGNYSRPLPRRIAEDAGIPRALFGVRKKAVTLNPFCSRDLVRTRGHLLTESSEGDFLHWIRAHRRDWWRRGRVPPIVSTRLNYMFNLLEVRKADMLNTIGEIRGMWRLVSYQFYEPKYLNRCLFPWAMARAKAHYRLQ